MHQKSGIYLDANAGAPLKPQVKEALVSLFDKPGSLVLNPSSIHAHGRVAKRLLADAREQIAQSLGNADPEQLIFTSSGTEANQLAIRSVLEPLLNLGQKPHWITSAIEHDSIRQMVSWVESRGGSVSVLPVDNNGVIQIEALEAAIRPETALFSFVWVNNETGVIQPFGKLAKTARKKEIPVHLDAAQAWGKIPFEISNLPVQMVSFSGHKMGGLGGTGVLYLARGTRVDPLILGKQEKGRRGGTENTLGLIALGAAVRGLDPVGWAARVEPLRNQLQNVISNRIPGVLINGELAPRVPNTLNLSFEGLDGEGLVMALDLAGYSVSSGSACSSGALEPSHVLMAMGRSAQEAKSAVRVSLVDEIDWDVLEGFVNVLEKTVARIRNSRKNFG